MPMRRGEEKSAFYLRHSLAAVEIGRREGEKGKGESSIPYLLFLQKDVVAQCMHKRKKREKEK